MTLTPDADADQRWAAAQKVADGEPDDRLPRRAQIAWIWISAGMVGVVLLGLVLIIVLPRSAPVELGSPDGWTARFIAAAAFLGTGIAVGAAGWIWSVRTRHYISGRRTVAGPLSPPERAWVRKQIRSASPVDDEQKRSVVLAVASQNRRAALGMLPIFFGQLMITVSVGVMTRSVALTWLVIILVSGFLVVGVFLARDYRRTGAYVDAFRGDRD
jgi:hypothetical protein